MPIVVSVVSEQQMTRMQVVDLKDLTKLAPGLLIGTSVLSIGQLVSIRGVGTSSTDPGIDQSVSLNIDGMSLGQGLAYSSGLFDVGQVEVLKGPQALFFGKGSPGGVISLRTADPTDKFEVIGKAAYDFDAHTRRGELVVSGPVADTLKARLAGMYQKSDGFYYNTAVVAPGTGALEPRYPRWGRGTSYQLRGTVLWEPSEKFDARLKANLVRDLTFNADNFQLVSCPDGVGAPFGIPFINPNENCKRDRSFSVVGMDPAVFPGYRYGGTPYVKILQRYGTLELNYRPIDDVTVTSVSAYYNLHSDSTLNTSFSQFAGPAVAVKNPRFRRKEFTQELRANTDFDSPLNFTGGAYYQDGKVSDRIVVDGNPIYGLPAVLADGVNDMKIKTYSLYGQGRWAIMPNLELAAGARWSDETRTLDTTLFGLPVALPNPRIHSSTVSPEVTLTYRPTDDLTIFGAFKKGYKSGSFSIATPAVPGVDKSFGDEKVEGFEAGVKGRLLDRQLSFSLAGYRYNYSGLQVGALIPVVGSLPIVRTVNAGAGRAYGAEFDFSYRPRTIDGLSMNGSANWNRTRFIELTNIPCYGGQTIADGCNLQLGPDGAFTGQDVSGIPFIRAPKWQVNFGFDYELPVGNEMKLIFSNSNSYSSRYLTNIGRRSDYFQKGFIKSDLSLTLDGPDERWSVAVIGKNVTNELTSGACLNNNAANGNLGGYATGTNTSGPAGIDEVSCFMDSGRALWLRLTFRPFN